MTNLTAFWQDPSDDQGGGGGDPAEVPTIMWDPASLSGAPSGTWFVSELPVGSPASATGTWTDPDASAPEPVDEIWLTMYGLTRTGTVSPQNGDAAFDAVSGVWSYSESSFKLTDDGKPITARIRDFDAQVAEAQVLFFWNMIDPLQRLIGHPNGRGPSTGMHWEWQSDGLSSGGTSWGGYSENYSFTKPTTGYGGSTHISSPAANTGHVCRLIATAENGTAGKAVQPHFGIAIPMGVTLNIEVLLNTGAGIVSQGTEQFEGPMEFTGKPDEATIVLPPYSLEVDDVMYIRMWADGLVLTDPFIPQDEDPKTFPVWQWTNMEVVDQAEVGKVPTDVVNPNGIFVDPVAGTFPTDENDFINNYLGDPTNPIKAHESWAKDAYQNLMPAGTYTVYQKRNTVANQMTYWNAVFPGTNNYVDLNSGALIGATDNFAIEFDIKIDAYPSTNPWAVLSQYSAGTAGRLLVSIRTDGKARFFIEDSTADVQIDSIEAIPTGEWVTLGIHRSGDEFALTVNRIDQGTQTRAGVSVQTSKDTFVGNDDGTLNDFAGRMRNFVFWVGPDAVGANGTETKFLTDATAWPGGAAVTGSITTEEVATGDALVLKGLVTSGTHLNDRKEFVVKPWDYTYGAKPVIDAAGKFPTSSQRYGKGQVGAVTFRNCLNSSIDGFVIRNSKHCGVLAEVEQTRNTTCDNITITDCFIHRSGTDGILFRGKPGVNATTFTTYPVTNVNVQYCCCCEANYGMKLSPNHVSGATGVVDPITGQAITGSHATDCTVRNVRAWNYFKEGFDAISSRRITFSDCYAQRSADSIYGTQRGTAFYSDSSGEGCEDITFERCVCAGDAGAFRISSEAGGPMTRIKFKSCVAYGTSSASLGLTDESQTGVVVTDCGFEHCSAIAGSSQYAVVDTLGSPVVGAGDIYVKNCIFQTDRTDPANSGNSYANWTIDNNWWFSTGGTITAGTGTGTNAVLNVDPLFKSATDLRLSSGSTAGAIELTLITPLTTDNITSVEVLQTIPSVVPASGKIGLIDDNNEFRVLDYSSYTGSTFTISSTDGSEDFATTNASALNAVWAGGISPAIRTHDADNNPVNSAYDSRGAYYVHTAPTEAFNPIFQPA